MCELTIRGENVFEDVIRKPKNSQKQPFLPYQPVCGKNPLQGSQHSPINYVRYYDMLLLGYYHITYAFQSEQ